jgi:mannose-1-phosphate guanylyltransferase
LLKAAAAVASRAVETILFGVTATTPTADYGWIAPGPARPARGAAGLRQVLRFVEKPTPETTAQLFRVGCLRNTMIFVSRAGAIADLYSKRLPDVARVFAGYRRCPAAARQAYLADAYSSMPSYDFSRDLLSSAAGLAVFTWPTSLGWTDLGTPERLARWHEESAAAAGARVAWDAPA